jgi:hypothetical protein
LVEGVSDTLVIILQAGFIAGNGEQMITDIVSGVAWLFQEQRIHTQRFLPVLSDFFVPEDEASQLNRFGES